jgi:hypothetical protein
VAVLFPFLLPFNSATYWAFLPNWIPFKNGSFFSHLAQNDFGGKMWHFAQESGAPSCFDPLGTVVKETDGLMTARISKEK